MPANDKLVGDLTVSCENGCHEEHALQHLMKLAEYHGAARVSSVSCVQSREGWLCVGRASAPPLCEEGS